MAEASRILLEHHLKKLKLPTVLREYEKLARQCAAEGLDHVQFLARLVEMETIDRERRLVERRIRQARFPVVKQLESFDFKAIPSLNKMLVLDLTRGDYIDRRENAILLGPSGVGKTHIALALGLAACQKGLAVRFTTASQLVHEMIEARDEKRLLRLQDQLARVSLLIVDELGYVPLSQSGSELLFDIFSRRYENGATIVYVIWNMALRGLFRTCPAARFPQPRAVRWAKVGRVRPLQGADSRSGATWANNRAKCAGSDFRAWRDWLKGSSGLRSNRCSGWHTTRLRPTGEDWKISCAGVAVREWWRDVRAATTWRATSSTFASVVDLGASGSSHWTRGQACRTRRFSSASRRFDCSSTFSSNRGFATSTR